MTIAKPSVMILLGRYIVKSFHMTITQQTAQLNAAIILMCYLDGKKQCHRGYRLVVPLDHLTEKTVCYDTLTLVNIYIYSMLAFCV